MLLFVVAACRLLNGVLDGLLGQRRRSLSHKLLIVHDMLEEHCHVLLAHEVFDFGGQLLLESLQFVLRKVSIVNEIAEVATDEHLNFDEILADCGMSDGQLRR